MSQSNGTPGPETNYYVQFTPLREEERPHVGLEEPWKARVPGARAAYEKRMRALMKNWEAHGVVDLGPVTSGDEEYDAKSLQDLRKVHIPEEAFAKGNIRVSQSLGSIIGPIQRDVEKVVMNGDAEALPLPERGPRQTDVHRAKRRVLTLV